MKSRAISIKSFVTFALWGAVLSGCGAADPATDLLAGEPPRVEPQQLDPGGLVWREITIAFDDGTPLATIYLFNQALGGFATGAEYWYVDQSAVGDLGERPLRFTVTDESTTTPPSDPGYASEQRFVLKENVSWGTGWITDPVSGGTLYTGSDANGSFVGLRLFATSSGLSQIVWYQEEPTPGCSVCNNVTPSGTFSVSSGPVAPAKGWLGYDISQTTGD